MAPYRSRITWGPLLPTDRARDILDEIALVSQGIHSRRRAAANLGDADHDIDFAAWLAENTQITSAGPPLAGNATERIQVS